MQSSPITVGDTGAVWMTAQSWIELRSPTTMMAPSSPAQHGLRPDGRAGPDGDVADDRGLGVDVGVGMDARHQIAEGVDGHGILLDVGGTRVAGYEYGAPDGVADPGGPGVSPPAA